MAKMTVGEYKKLLAAIPDELEIVGYQSDMERCGIMPMYARPRVIKVKEVTHETWDRFDGTDYTYTTLEESPDGTKEVCELF